MKDVFLSIKIVFLFLTREKNLNSYLTNIGLFDEPDLLKTRLRKISTFIISFFPMTFIFIYYKSGVAEYFAKTFFINSFFAYIITTAMVFITVFITGLIILSIVLFAYVFNFVLKHKSN